jgi:hypothetical protein
MDKSVAQLRFLYFFVSILLFLMFAITLPSILALGDALGPENLNFLGRCLYGFATLTPLMLKFPFLAFTGIPLGFLLEKTQHSSQSNISGPKELPPDQAERLASERKKVPQKNRN